MERTLKRIQQAILDLDLGISDMTMRNDFLGGLNRALREVGGSQVFDLEDEAPLVRAMLSLEAAV
jgi:hypothetical protein